MLFQCPPPERAILCAADQRNWKRLHFSQQLNRARDPVTIREQPEQGTAAARHQGHGRARAHQSLLECSQLPVLLEDHRFKIITGGSQATRVPRNRLETNYFILLRFGCQTGAQVAIGLGGVHVDAGSHQNTPQLFLSLSYDPLKSQLLLNGERESIESDITGTVCCLSDVQPKRYNAMVASNLR